MTTIRIDVSVGDDELKQYGKVFHARDLAEAKKFLLEDLTGDPFLWGKRLVRVVGREGVEIKVSEVKK